MKYANAEVKVQNRHQSNPIIQNLRRLCSVHNTGPGPGRPGLDYGVIAQQKKNHFLEGHSSRKTII